MKFMKRLRGSFSITRSSKLKERIMPVIRGQSHSTSLTTDRREALREELVHELSGKTTSGGPLIFEIPLEQSDKIDVIVVWNAFEGIRAEDRTSLILEAYDDQSDRISLAMGSTYHEAIEQHLLPYTVIPKTRSGPVNQVELRQAMLEEGGVALSDERVELRFPTLAMAEAAYQRLSERFPSESWSLKEVSSLTP
jgi:hypothetical protein